MAPLVLLCISVDRKGKENGPGEGAVSTIWQEWAIGYPHRLPQIRLAS